MGKTRRSLFSSEQEIISRTHLEEIVQVVESLAKASILNSPLSVVLRNIRDLILFLKIFLEGGPQLNETAVQIKLEEDPSDPLKFAYANEVNKESGSMPGKPLWFHSGTIASKRLKMKNPHIWLTPMVENFLLDTAEVLTQLAINPEANPYLRFGKQGSDIGQRIHLTHRNWQYWRRQRARRKSKHSTGDTKR